MFNKECGEQSDESRLFVEIDFPAAFAQQALSLGGGGESHGITAHLVQERPLLTLLNKRETEFAGRLDRA